MTPSSCQLKLLRLYRDYRSCPPNAGTCVRRNLFPLAILLCVVGAGLWVATHSDGLWFGLGCFAAGVGVGSLLRIVRQLINAVRLWPLLCEIVDWKKVDSLLTGKPST